MKEEKSGKQFAEGCTIQHTKFEAARNMLGLEQHLTPEQQVRAH